MIMIFFFSVYLILPNFMQCPEMYETYYCTAGYTCNFGNGTCYKVRWRVVCLFFFYIVDVGFCVYICVCFFSLDEPIYSHNL